MQKGSWLRRLFWLLPIALAVALDQLTKILVSANMEIDESIPLIDGVIDIHYITNDGAAFGGLDEHRWVFMLFSTVAIVALGVFMFGFYKKYYNALLFTSLSLIVGGGIGNMIDRIAYGEVIDFVDVKFIPFWHYIFNVADIFVCVGCGLVIFYLIKDEINTRKQKKADSKSE